MWKITKKIARNLKPFKGQYAYEIQILPFVLQWRHDGKIWKDQGVQFFNKRYTHFQITIGRFCVWTDSAWLVK
jgi:hypothetical protein